MEDSGILRAPELIAQEISDDLESPLEPLATPADDLKWLTRSLIFQ